MSFQSADGYAGSLRDYGLCRCPPFFDVVRTARCRACYDNFAWFLNGVTDALLAAQNLCVEAEAHGLGICYLGTTIYTAEEIARILDLPKG